MAIRQRAFTTDFAPSNEADFQTAHQVKSLLIGHSSLNRVQCGFEVSVQLPDSRLAASGKSANEAFNRFCSVVSDFDVSKASSKEILACLMSGTPTVNPRTATKAAQKTIGVSSKTSLLELLDAEYPGERAAAARNLFDRGFKALDRRLDNESSKDVFEAFQAAYDELPESPTEQWMLRLDPKTYGRAIVRAQEYGKSASNLAALCLAYALVAERAAK